MKQAEKDQKNRADRDRFRARIVDLEGQREDLNTKLAAVSLDSALGNEVASKAEADAKQGMASITDQVATLQRAVDRLDREYLAGEPAREAQRKETARAQMEDIISRLLDRGLAIRAAAEAMSKAIGERASVVEEFRLVARGLDLTPPVEMPVIWPSLARLTRLDHALGVVGGMAGPSSVELDDARRYRHLAPQHPVVLEVQAEIDRQNAEMAAARRNAGKIDETTLWPGAQIMGRRPVKRVMGAEVVEDH